MKTSIIALAFAAISFAAPAMASDPRVTISNESSSDVYRVQMSNIDANAWGDDLLGDDVLETGYEAPMMSPSDADSGYCRYDLRVTFADGRTMTLNDVNTCAAKAILIRNRSFDIATLDGDVTNRRAAL